MADGKPHDKPSGVTGPGSETKPPISTGLDQRMNKLETELVKKGVLKTPAQEGERSETSASVAQAVKLSSEFIGGIVVGAFVGWFIDRFAGTSPWGLIVFLLLGFLAGTLNVLRSAGYVAEKGDITTRQDENEKK